MTRKNRRGKNKPAAPTASGVEPSSSAVPGPSGSNVQETTHPAVPGSSTQAAKKPAGGPGKQQASVSFEPSTSKPVQVQKTTLEVPSSSQQSTPTQPGKSVKRGKAAGGPGKPKPSISPESTSKPAKVQKTTSPAVAGSSKQSISTQPANLPRKAGGRRKSSNVATKSKEKSKSEQQNVPGSGPSQTGGRKKKSPRPIAKSPPKNVNQIKVSKFTHAPAVVRLKFSILFKQETAFYSPDILKTPLINHQFKITRAVIEQKLHIIKSLEQIHSKDLIDDIVTTFDSVLKNNNPLLINYDIFLYELAKCLTLVKQDPKNKQPSPTVIDFRTKIISLAVVRIAGFNSERLLQFVFYLLNLSKNILRCSLLRRTLCHWYKSKRADQLVLLCAKCSSYKGVTHDTILDLIHFNIKGVSSDMQLALIAIRHGFNLISQRITNGSFPQTTKGSLPPFLNELDCYVKASAELKAVIHDVALVRSPLSHKKPVAAAVRKQGLSMQYVHAQFNRCYKANSAAMESSTTRQLLRDMHHYRIHNVLSSKEEAKVDDEGHTIVDTYVRRLLADDDTQDVQLSAENEGADNTNTVEATLTKEPPIHPPEVMSAYAEYVLAPQKVFERCINKGDGTDHVNTPDAAMKVRPPEPAILKALEELYTKSFKNLQKHELKIVICIDLQETIVTNPCRHFNALQGYHECMLIVQCLSHMVTNASDLKVLGFKNKLFKPVVRLKKHTPVVKPEDKGPDDEKTNLETVSDTGDVEMPEVKQEEEVKEEEVEVVDEKTMIEELDSMWTHYRRQVSCTRGITVHKLFSLATMWHQFLPDVFVVITTQDNLSLYKVNLLFAEYVETTKKENTKLLVISPCSHLKAARLIHRHNMLHIVGYDANVTHMIEEFLANKLFPTGGKPRRPPPPPDSAAQVPAGAGEPMEI